MANQITDNRTNVFSFETLTGVVDLSGAGAGTLDAEIFVQGANSVGLYTTNSIDGLMYDAGTAQDWSGNVFYIWVNCGIVGLLATKAAGGMRIRFCGATVTDYFEVYVGGNDSWPATVSGGWAQFVVDIDDAHLNASAIGGTKPATTAIRYVGMASVTGGTMPRMADNTWLDEIQRLPANTPGIIIEGRNAGLTDWDSADIFTQLGVSVGTFVPAPGGAWKVNTPIQFGINDTTAHAFTDTNSIWLWDDQEFIDDTLYKLSALGNVGGTTNITLGAKTGVGDVATGAQGLTIAAASLGARWDMDFNDPNLDGVNFYGCSLQHGGDFLLDDIAVSFISTLYIDCSSALVTNSEQLRCSIINANTLDGVAFMTTDKLDDIVFCTFEWSDGHAVELTTPNTSTHASKGNTFTGFALQAGNANDRALYNNSGAGLVTINVTDGGTDISYRNGTSATTTIILNPVDLTLHAIDRSTGADIVGARAYVTAGVVGPLPYQDSVTITRVTTTASVVHTAHGLSNGDQVYISGAVQSEYNGLKTISNVSANAYDYTVAGSPTTPATGTIISTAVIIEGITGAGGLISDTRTYIANQDFEGWVRDASGSAPFYEQTPLTGTIDKDNGTTVVVGMQEN